MSRSEICAKISRFLTVEDGFVRPPGLVRQLVLPPICFTKSSNRGRIRWILLACSPKKDDGAFDFFRHHKILEVASALNVKIVSRRFCSAVGGKRLLFVRGELELHIGGNTFKDAIL